MTLWQRLLAHDGVAVYADQQSVSYARLRTQSQALAAQLWGPSPQAAGRQLVLLQADNSLPSLLNYLACLWAGHAILLVNADLPAASVEALLQQYDPHLWLRPAAAPLPRHARPLPLLPELALLLTTSGSTGGAKLVRLSEQNLIANAESIVTYLEMAADHLALTALPFAYSYGLSVIHSHLLCGAGLVLTNDGPLQRGFWECLKRYPVTQLTGVPYSYQIYEQLRLRRQVWPHLRILTQAGGRLAPERVHDYALWCREQGIRFYVMYGQTEATARISYLPPELAADHPDSIGVAIPGGELLLLDEAGVPQPLAYEVEAELGYRGPNVMLGYAETQIDLAAPAMPALLRTGDLGYCSADGLWHITGRLKRQIKLSGVRWQLDSLERQCRDLGWELVACGQDQALRIACSAAEEVATVSDYLHLQLGLHPSLFRVAALQELPRTAAGKLDYPALQRAIEEASA